MQNAIIKNTALAAVLATGTMFTTVAQAVTIEGNVGATTDYIWRGMTQNDGDPASRVVLIFHPTVVFMLALG